MTDTTAERRRAVVHEASEWLVRLQDDDLPDTELTAFGLWIAASPEHAAAFEEVGALWDAAGGLDSGSLQRARDGRVEPAPRPAATVERVRSRRPRVLRWAVGLAASLAVVAGAVHLLQPQDAAALHYATGIGERRHIALDDGSTLDLDAGTEVVVRYADDRRSVELQRGTAFFDVAHAPQRPFFVDAGPVQTRVLGTRFAVGHRADGDIAITVLQGRVRVGESANADIGSGFEATAGQRVDFRGAQGLDPPRSINAELSTAWRGGTVVYQGERLANVIADLNRYSRVPVQLQDPAFGDMKVTGRWEMGGVDRWLDGLARSVGFRVVRGADVVLLSRDADANNGSHRSPDTSGSGVD